MNPGKDELLTKDARNATVTGSYMNGEAIFTMSDADGGTEVLRITGSKTLVFNDEVEPREAARIFSDWVNSIPSNEPEISDSLRTGMIRFLREISGHMRVGVRGLGVMKYGPTASDQRTFNDLKDWAETLLSELEGSTSEDG